MAPGTLVLTRAPAFSAALGYASQRWAEVGGLLVVPSREAAADALREAAGGGVAIGREAVTFAALRGRVAAALGVAEPEVPSRVVTRLALREVLDRVDLSAFGASARAPGFLTGVERAVGELRVAAVPPERVRAVASDARSTALAEIHAAAWSGVAHPSDALWSVAAAADDLDAFPAVTVAGFDDLVPGQWALLRALARVAPVEVVIEAGTAQSSRLRSPSR